MGEAGVGERSHPAGVPGASGAGGRWRGGAEGSSPPGPCAAVTARGWTRTPTRDAPLASPSFLGGGVGRCGLTATRCARRPAPSACSPRAPGAARLGPRRRARIPTRETACKFMNEAPGSCRRPPGPRRRERLASGEPQLLLRASVSGRRRLGLFSSNSWKSRVAVGWLACLRPEAAAACRKPGIGRLTSDIGLRPNARCPARGRRRLWPLESEHPEGTVRPPGRRHRQPTSAAPRMLPRACGCCGSWCRGVSLFGERLFGKLSPFSGLMVTSSVVMVTGHQMQKTVSLHPRSFPKATEVLCHYVL